MKKFLLAGLLLLSSYGFLLAQNKTLGVGITTPNQNAALHVESPTNNQGFIMPRLTTAQRNAMSALLTNSDNGLMLFDTDLKTIFIWDGLAWKNSAQVAGGSKLVYPYVDTVSSPGPNPNLFKLVYAGSETENAGIAHFENLNPSSRSYAVHGISHGDSLSAGVYGQNTGNGFGVVGRSSGAKFASAAVYGEHNGTGDAAGAFRIDNASNPYSALYGETNGPGSALRSLNIGSGNGAYFRKNGANPNSAAMWADNFGDQGYGGIIQNISATNPFAALFVESVGTGPSIWANKMDTETGNSIEATHEGASGHAGYFRLNPTNGNNNAAIIVQNYSSGDGGYFEIDNAATNNAAVKGRASGPSGVGGAFEILDENNQSAAFYSFTNGTGPAANFNINNSSSSSSAVNVYSQSTGQALSVTSTQGWTAFQARREGATNGNAGLFETVDAENTYSTLQIVNAGSGAAVNVNNSNAQSSSPAIFITSSSSGPTLITANNSESNGEAARFEINNSNNNHSAISANTVGNGTVLIVNHQGASGDLAAFQNNNSNVARIDRNGVGFFNGGTVNSGADLAEMFEVEGSKGTYEPGDVLIISENTDRTVEKSNRANSTKVAGVYATKPGVMLTERTSDEDLSDLVPMGVVGVIPTKVCLENGPIKRGDLLVTSSKAGHAMKAVPVIINGIEVYPTGAILGKALENFDGSTEAGLIKVLVNVK